MARRRVQNERVASELLAFHFAPNETPTLAPRVGKRTEVGKRTVGANLANYRFTLHPRETEYSILGDPDKLVRWSDVVSVRVPIEDSARAICAICLDDVDWRMSRITRCGHIYCLLCISRYLCYGAYACPVCLECLSDLKRVEFISERLEVDKMCHFQLCTLPAGAICPSAVLELGEGHPSSLASIPSLESPSAPYSRYCVDGFANMLQRLDSELAYLLDLHTECAAQEQEQEQDRCGNFRYGFEYLPLVTSALALQQEERDKLFELAQQAHTPKMNREKSSSAAMSDTNSPFFYMVAEGEYFLHPINRKCLLSMEPVPTSIVARIIAIEKIKMTAETRKKFLFLRHQPLGGEVGMVEIDLTPLVDPSTLSPFLAEIQKRERARAEVLKKKQNEIRVEQRRMLSKAQLVKSQCRQREKTFEDLLTGPIVGDSADAKEEGHLHHSLVEHSLVEQSVEPASPAPALVTFSAVTQGARIPTLETVKAKGKFKKGATLITNASSRSFK